MQTFPYRRTHSAIMLGLCITPTSAHSYIKSMAARCQQKTSTNMTLMETMSPSRPHSRVLTCHHMRALQVVLQAILSAMLQAAVAPPHQGELLQAAPELQATTTGVVCLRAAAGRVAQEMQVEGMSKATVASATATQVR